MRVGIVSVIAASLIFLGFVTGFSEEMPIQGGAIPQAESEPQMQWLWGEVVNLDLQNKIILVKYLDYETDESKEISVMVDDSTAYENIKSIEELKPNDAVSVDYIVTAEGANIAKNVSVEKPEETKISPEDLQQTEPIEQ